jgi:hypothetical protein
VPSEVNKWLLSIVARLVGAALTFGATVVAGRIAADDTSSREQASFLREQRVKAYAEFITALVKAEDTEERLTYTMLNTGDQSYFAQQEGLVTSAMYDVQAAKSQIDVIGSPSVITAAATAMTAYQHVLDAIHAGCMPTSATRKTIGTPAGSSGTAQASV